MKSSVKEDGVEVGGEFETVYLWQCAACENTHSDSDQIAHDESCDYTTMATREFTSTREIIGALQPIYDETRNSALFSVLLRLMHVNTTKPSPAALAAVRKRLDSAANHKPQEGRDDER